MSDAAVLMICELIRWLAAGALMLLVTAWSMGAFD